MNTKEWIKPYRDAIDQQYKLDDVAQQDVDFYFTKLEKYAAGFPDQGSFATSFSKVRSIRGIYEPIHQIPADGHHPIGRDR